MTRALALIAFAALPAMAQDVHTWGPTSHVVMQATSQPGAVAEVVFLNDIAQSAYLEIFTLTFDGLTVGIRIDARVGAVPDTMTVTPPPGFIAIPPDVTVGENGAGVVLIMEDATS